MSCCPKAPEIKIGNSSGENEDTRTTEMLPGETSECYLKRAGNPTGKHDDATGHPPDKIENNDIPMTGGDEAKNVVFRLTPESTKVPTTWTFVAKETALPSGVTFTSNGATATLNGVFPKETYGKKFKFELTAMAGAETIDMRGYVFSPAKMTGSNEIRFVHPMPGAICNSPFSTSRLHPITKIYKPHWGADFVMPSRVISDIVAAADGEVTFAAYSGSAGNKLIIKHFNATGQHLCSSVYMHLASFYVAPGQRVVAGQKVAREDTTGGSTGPHLHFECRLPNNSAIDPVPLIKGTISVARETLPDNQAKPGTLEDKSANAALTPENVTAKEGGCEPFGQDYPKDPSAPPIEPPPPITDIFEKAWYQTLKHEVGPHWTTAYPNDPEVAAGLIETKSQRHKVGYVSSPGFPGGITKFGIAQNHNTDYKVPEIGYPIARSIAFNKYWKGAPKNLSTTKPKTAIALFDMTYLHGAGGANSIKRGIDMTSMTDDAAVEALIAAQQNYISGLANQKMHNEWLKRSRDLLAYVKTIT